MNTEHDNNSTGQPAEPDTNPAPQVSEITAGQTGDRQSKLGAIRHWYTHKKKLSIPLTILVLLGILLAVPVTRYAVLGTFMSKDVFVRVIDRETKTPVSGALVEIDGVGGETNADGEITLGSVKVGNHTAIITKKYYKDSHMNVVVPVLSKPNTVDGKLEATGRQAKITVSNKISGAVLADATLKILDTEARTDEKGEAVIVLPASTTKQQGVLTKNGFNDTNVTIEVSSKEIKNNVLSLTPEGKIYFLSKRTGKIDVMKSNLDGTDAKVILAGTGKEDDTDTILLASRDWKYLALKSRRDSDQAKLYLIETANDKLTNIDEGNAIFDLVGWNNSSFIYIADRQNIEAWQPKKYALKSFNATNRSLKTLQESGGSGSSNFDYRNETFRSDSVSAFDGKVIFVKNTNANFGAELPESTINTINNDGTGFKVLKSFNPGRYIDAKVYAPEEVYFRVYGQSAGTDEFFEYEDGTVKTIKREDYEKSTVYPTYLLSPNGKQNLWSEQRDGNSVLFIGDENGENGKVVDNTTPFQPYGWYTDDYILITNRELAELFILPREWPKNNTEKKYLKVTNYHKPARIFYGYGGGYGGL